MSTFLTVFLTALLVPLAMRLIYKSTTKGARYADGYWILESSLGLKVLYSSLLVLPIGMVLAFAPDIPQMDAGRLRIFICLLTLTVLFSGWAIAEAYGRKTYFNDREVKSRTFFWSIRQAEWNQVKEVTSSWGYLDFINAQGQKVRVSSVLKGFDRLVEVMQQRLPVEMWEEALVNLERYRNNARRQ